MLNLKSIGSNDQLVRLWHEEDWPEMVRYGTSWDQSEDGRYLVPGYLCGSDYSGSLVERSNYECFAETFSDGEDEWWTRAHGGYGTYSIIISLDRVPDEAADDVAEWLEALESYPLADESHHSELEMVAEDEAWSNWAEREFRQGIERRFSCEIPDASDLRELFHQCAERANRYWEDQQGGDMYIDVAKVLDKVTRDDVAALGATFEPEE